MLMLDGLCFIHNWFAVTAILKMLLFYHQAFFLFHISCIFDGIINCIFKVPHSL